MAWVASTVIAVGAMAASTAVGVYSSIEAGKAADSAAEAQARQAEADAVSSLVERKRALIESLANQNVEAAAQGRTIGSIATLQQEDVRRAGYDETLIKGGASAEAASYRSAGSAAKTQSYLKAGTSLLGGVSSVAMLSTPAPKKT